MNYKDDRSFIRTIPNDPADDIVKPKVLFACINAPSYSPAGQIDGFKRCGYEVIAFDWQHIRYEIGIEDMLERLIVKAITEKPELIFLQFQNGDILDVETAKELSKHGFVVNFSEDVRTDLTWFEEIAPHIGLTVFTNIDDVEKLKAKGIRAEYSPTSFNNILYKKSFEPKVKKAEYKYGEVILIANNYVNTNLNFPKAQERQDMVAFMKKEFGNKFQVFGLGQENRMLNMNECAEAYNECKIAITQSNFNRKGYCSDRDFNAIACGALTLSEYFEPVSGFDFPFIFWHDLEDLAIKTKIFLEDGIGRGILSHQMNKDIMEQHTWAARFLRLKKLVEQIKSLS